MPKAIGDVSKVRHSGLLEDLPRDSGASCGICIMHRVNIILLLMKDDSYQMPSSPNTHIGGIVTTSPHRLRRVLLRTRSVGRRSGLSE